MAIANFLFGSGWWVLWHLFLLGSFVPMFFALRRLRTRETEDESPNGEALFRLLVGIAFALIAGTLVDGGLLGWAAGGIRGAMWGTIAGLVFCTTWTLALFAFAKKLIVPSDDPAQTTTPAVVLFALWHAGFVAANLVALAKIHS